MRSYTTPVTSHSSLVMVCLQTSCRKIIKEVRKRCVDSSGTAKFCTIFFLCDSLFLFYWPYLHENQSTEYNIRDLKCYTTISGVANPTYWLITRARSTPLPDGLCIKHNALRCIRKLFHSVPVNKDLIDPRKQSLQMQRHCALEFPHLHVRRANADFLLHSAQAW